MEMRAINIIADQPLRISLSNFEAWGVESATGGAIVNFDKVTSVCVEIADLKSVKQYTDGIVPRQVWQS